MTTDNDFDRIATAWLADGPDELSDRVLDAVADQIHLTRQRRVMRVPWRFHTMTTPARVAAAAVIGVLAIGGAFMLLGKPGQPAVGGPPASPSASVSAAATASPAVQVASPSASAAAVPALPATFTSPRHGYRVNFPFGWTATAATKSWASGTNPMWGDPALDAINGGNARLSAASQPLVTGQTADAWQVAYCGSTGTKAASCGRPISIGGVTGYVGQDGLPSSGGIVEGGIFYDASVVVGGRGYQFDLDGHVDRALFEALLASVTFDGASAVDLPALTGRFTSPTYGYSIGLVGGWTARSATTKWVGPDNSPPSVDEVTITGTDTTVAGASQALAKGQTFDQWLVPFHQLATGVLPPGCDGGDPSTWASINVGGLTGKFAMYCNAAEAAVDAGGRVYVFGWGNATFTGTDHFGLASWKDLLKSVAFAPATAK